MPITWRFIRNVLLKSAFILVLLSLLFAALRPLPWIGRASLYNWAVPGRLRFPFGENPAQSYNLSLYPVEAMFASHVIAGTPKSPAEFRVIVIGDSSVWGTLLRPAETLPGLLDARRLPAPGGRSMRFYNLGYPTISLTKDVMLLQEAMRYQPDLVIWLVTLESFPLDRQLTTPLLQNNPARVQSLLAQTGLALDASPLIQPTFWDQTIIGQRRNLADIARLQLYGVMWGATSIDQAYPADYPPAARDLADDPSYHGWQPPTLDPSLLAFDALRAGLQVAGDVPVLLINEPMLISQGRNSSVRYNFFYPRWAYDQYRTLLAEQAAASGWLYADLWNLVPGQEFTNSAIHLTPAGEALLADAVADLLKNLP